MAKLRRLDGARVELQLAPRPGAGEQLQAKRLFDSACRLVQSEWKKRSLPFTNRSVPSKRRRQPHTSRDLPWLMVTTYEIISEMLQLEHDDVFESRIAHHGRCRRGRIGEPNRFQVGLMAMFADDPDALNARDRDRIGKNCGEPIATTSPQSS